MKELAKAYFGWGWALDKIGRHDEANEKYKRAEELGWKSYKSDSVNTGESPL